MLSCGVQNVAYKITYQKLITDTQKLAQQILNHGNSMKIYDNIYAVPRGGVLVGYILSQELDRPLIENIKDVNYHTLVVDDLIDSGLTKQKFPDSDYAVLYRKPHAPLTTYSIEEIDDWIEFPYEETDKDELENITRLLERYGKSLTEVNISKAQKLIGDL